MVLTIFLLLFFIRAATFLVTMNSSLDLVKIWVSGSYHNVASGKKSFKFRSFGGDRRRLNILNGYKVRQYRISVARIIRCRKAIINEIGNNLSRNANRIKINNLIYYVCPKIIIVKFKN